MIIPNDIRDFISDHIASFQQLEVLLAVSSEPARAWTTTELSERLQMNPTTVTTRLLSLCVKKLIKAEETNIRTYRYRSDNNGTDNMMVKTHSFYKQHPFELKEFVSSLTEWEM